MTKIKNNNLLYIDIIRIFACFMVIINHTSGLILDGSSTNTTVYCILFSLCKMGVPLFLMISGVLLLDKNYNYKKVFKCIIRVLIPVLVISLLLFIKDNGIKDISLFIKNIISKPYLVPYWYIYALIGIYLTIPFLQKMIKNFKDKDYIVFCILFLIIPTFVGSLKLYINFNINNYLSIAFFPVIISTAICGNYISKTKLTKRLFIISIFTFLISYSMMFISMYLPYLNNQGVSYKLDSWNSFPIVLMTISIFYIARYIFENKNPNNIISAVASTTFGIYLIHFVLYDRVYKTIKFIFNFNSILGILTLDIAVFIVCMVIIYILKKIPLVKKYL